MMGNVKWMKELQVITCFIQSFDEYSDDYLANNLPLEILAMKHTFFCCIFLFDYGSLDYCTVNIGNEIL